MFSSKKILYYIILSLLILCSVAGIDFRSSYYSGESDSIVDFSDSSFFAPSELNLTDTEVGVLENEGENAVSIVEYSELPTTTTSATEEPIEETTTASETAVTTTTTTTAARPDTGTTTTTTRTTTTTARTTTTTVRTTTTTTAAVQSYQDTDGLSFEYPAIRMYVGNTATVNLVYPIAAQQLASFTSLDTGVATVRELTDNNVVITGISVGTTYIEAVSISNSKAYCQVIVTDYASEVIRLVNVERSNYGVPELKKGSATLQAVADLRASESTTKFDHERPNGTRFFTAAQEFGLTYSYLGENLARGQTTPQQVVDEWMASPTHRDNILSTNYTHLCVCYTTDSGGFPYWAQTFWKSR